MEYIEKLHQCSLFKGINKNNISTMLYCLGIKYKSYKKGDYIVIENDSIDYIGIILSGSLDMIKEDVWGNKTTLIRLMPLEIFGESFACGHHQEATVSFFCSKDVEVVLLPVQKVLKTCSNACPFHLKMLENMVYVMADKNRKLMKKTNIISKMTLREKILTFLSLEAEQQHKKYFEISLNRNELADYLCANRSALTRELNSMKQEGIIDFDKNTFHILKGDI